MWGIIHCAIGILKRPADSIGVSQLVQSAFEIVLFPGFRLYIRDVLAPDFEQLLPLLPLRLLPLRLLIPPSRARKCFICLTNLPE